MNRLYMPVFVLLILLAQWGSLNHAYHVHESGDVCDYCLSAQALDHVITSTIQFVFASSFQQFQSEQMREDASIQSVRYYAVRAPPRFI